MTALGEFAREYDVTEQDEALQPIQAQGGPSVGVPLPIGPEGRTGNGVQLSSPQSLNQKDGAGDSHSRAQFHASQHENGGLHHGTAAHTFTGSGHDSISQSSQGGFLSTKQTVGVPLPGLGSSGDSRIRNNVDFTVGDTVSFADDSREDSLFDALENRLETIEDIMEKENLGSSLELLRETNLLEQLLDEGKLQHRTNGKMVYN